MGCIDPIEASLLAYKYTSLIDNKDYPVLCSQTCTSIAKLGYSVNLYKLSECKNTLFIPELFAACRMTSYNPVSVNIFSTGSVVACGLKEPEDMIIILNDIDKICKSINK